MKNLRVTLLFLVSMLCTASSLFAQSGIYVGGHFRRERNHTITDLKASGFTYVILFNIQVEANGNLTTDGEVICSNGTYVFGNTSPNYAADVASLKTGVTSINRVESCIGGWGNTAYTNIRNIVNAQGTGTGSILYRNFQALKNAIPSMDAINNDDEGTYDVATATAFHVMLRDLGYLTTLAPYTNKPFWQSLATNINNQRPGAVDKIYLQVYDGGAGNNPCDWNINNIEMHTGDLYYEQNNVVINKMTNAKNNCGSKGGFMWVYNDNNINLKDQANRINTIFNIRTKNQQEVANFFNDCNYQGFANGLPVGDYNLAALQANGINDNAISGLTVAEGFEITLYDGTNLTGTSKTYTAGTTCLVGDGWNDRTGSLKVTPNGVTTLAGNYFVRNRNSNLNMDVWGASTANGGNVAQGNASGQGENQQWALTHLGDGLYKMIVKHSGKSLDVNNFSKNNGANVEQYDYSNTPNQQFVFVSTGDGYYKIIPKHSGKVVEVAGASTANGANVQQWQNNDQTCGQWKLIPVTTPGTGTGLAGNYFNGMNFETLKYTRTDATINYDWGNGSPNAAVNADQFSARWTGLIQPRFTGEYTFYINSDNGRRLWINNQLIINQWADNTGEYTGKITLTAGQKYEIKLEYFENIGGANCKLEWSSFYQDREVIPQTQLFANTLPTVSITSPANNAGFNAPASITIDATAADAGGSISKIDFYNGTTFLGSDNTAPYSYTWTGVAAGTYNLTALATDNRTGVTLSSVVTVKVNQLPTVSITAPTNNATYVAAATVNFTAAAADADGSITKVDYYNGASLIGTSTASPYNFSWTTVGVGTYTITAKATDNSGAVTTSAPITVKVNANVLPTVAITSPTNNATGTAPAGISIVATATDTDGTITKVEFFEGNNKLGEDLINPYTFNWANVAAGTYSLTAKATDNKTGVTTSSIITVIISNPNQAPSVVLTSPSENASFVAPATVILTAVAQDPDGSVTKVEFFQGNTKLGEDLTTPYSFTWTGAAEGTYELTAKATDNAGATLTTMPVTITITAALPTGIDKESMSGLVLFPNPVLNQVTLQTNNLDLSDASFQLIDVLGKTVLQGTATSSVLDLSKVEAGIYIFMITKGERTFSKTIIKQ